MKTKKKVVIVSPLRVYPVISGGNLRTSFIAYGFNNRGYDVLILSLANKRLIDGAPINHPKQIGEVTESSSLFTLMSRIGYRFGIPAFWIDFKLRILGKMLHRKYLADADILVSDSPYTIWGLKKFKGLKIFNTHNVEHARYTKSLRIRNRLRDIESEAHLLADITLCCTPSDAEYFENLGGKSEVYLLPNGIDASLYSEDENLKVEVRAQLCFHIEDTVLLFPASIYGPNVEGAEFLISFSEHYYNRLKELGIRISIVGSVLPAKKYNELLESYGKVPRIEPFFKMADIAINPIFSGSGSSLKVAEFISAKLPLLTTKIGARGFDLDDQSACFFSDESSLIDALEHLIDQKKRWKELSERAWQKNSSFILGDKAFDELDKKINSFFENE